MSWTPDEKIPGDAPVLLGGNKVLMLCQFDPCPECSKLMVPGIKADRLFPPYMGYNLKAQMKRGNLVFCSGSLNHKAEKICIECAVAGKATFICALCQQERGSDQVQESFGDPADHLCKTCYETVPAKQWEAKHEALCDAHRYDFD